MPAPVAPPAARRGAAPPVDEAHCRSAYRKEIDPCRKLAGEDYEDCVNRAYLDLGRCLDRL